MKISKEHEFHFASAPDGGNLAGALNEKKTAKQMVIIPERSEGTKSFRVTQK